MMSTKLKVTIFTTFLMSVIVLLVLLFMSNISNEIIKNNCVNKLISSIKTNAKELEFKDGQLDLQDVVFYKNNVYTMIYSYEGELIATGMKNIPNFNLDFENEEVKWSIYNGEEYYIFDLLVDVIDYGKVWVRGIICETSAHDIVSEVLIRAVITLPNFVLLAGIGAYIIAKKSLEPIERIVNTAKNIKKSEDLSLRINLGEGNDEIHQLASTFDEMFQTIENAFEYEKQFSSDVSHELRTPTAVILAQCEYALESQSTVEDKDEALKIVQKQGQKMLCLISNLLNLTRLDTGVEKAQFSTTNLSELVLITCEEIECICEKNIKLTYDIQEGIYANVDYDMMIRMISNLISNAFKYGVLDGYIKVRLFENKKNIVLSVKDNGIGIEENDIKNIWKRFYQIDKSRTSSEQGVGLGLAIVSQIAKIHDAKIEIKSQIKKGSTFKITFKK